MVDVAYGFDGNLTETAEALKMRTAVESAYRHGVWSGGVVSAGTGRTVNVSAVEGHICGVYFSLDAVTGLSVGTAPTGTNKRIDVIAVEANWGSATSALGTPANSAKVVRVPGSAATSPLQPSLTTTPGNVWQMPLARFTDASTVSAVAAANLEACAPLPRRPYPLTGTVRADTMRDSASSWNALGTITVPDPGWPYRLQVFAQVRFAAASSGVYVDIRAADLGTKGTVYGQASSMNLTAGNQSVSINGQVSDVLTGARQVRLEMLPDPVGAASGQTLSVLDRVTNHYTITQLPA